MGAEHPDVAEANVCKEKMYIRKIQALFWVRRANYGVRIVCVYVIIIFWNIIIASRSAIIWLNDCVLKVWIFSWYIRRSGVVKVSIIIFRCDACNFRFKDLALLWIIFNEWFLNIRSVIRFWILYGWKLKVFWSICLIDIIGVVSFKRSMFLFNHINIEAKT